jgi:hypothetical protein
VALDALALTDETALDLILNPAPPRRVHVCTSFQRVDLGSIVSTHGLKVRTTCVCGHSTWTDLPAPTRERFVPPPRPSLPSTRRCEGECGGFVEADRVRGARFCLPCRTAREHQKSKKKYAAARARS